MNRITRDNDRVSDSPLKAGKILSRYVKKNALLAMLLSILGLWALQVVFSYLAELEDFSDTYTYSQAIKYIFYRSPYFLEQFIPTGALLGGVVGLGLLANSSELVVMRAAGVSIYRIVAWVLQPAFIFVVVALAINQYVLPYSNLKASQIREPDTALLASVNGYWTIQPSRSTVASHDVDSDNVDGAKAGVDNSIADSAGSDIFFIDYADANGNIGEVKLWHLDSENNLTSVSKAKQGNYLPTNTKTPINQADLVQYQWQLSEVRTLSLAKRAALNLQDPHTPNTIAPNSAAVQSVTPPVSISNAKRSADILASNTPLTTRQVQDSKVISLPISPSSVYLLTRRAEDLSLTQLYDHQRFNALQGTRSLEHELAFWQKLLSPFAILSLVIVACSFVFGSLRTHSLGLRIVVAIIFGLLFSYLQDLTGFIALATGVSPLIMVLLPIISSAILGLYLIKRQS